MELCELLKTVDHTLLRPDAGWEEIRTLCDDAVAYQTASICIAPAYVQQAARYLDGRLPVCTVVGFPNGYTTTDAKEFEAKEAIAMGAAEIDMVANIGWIKDHRYDSLLEEIRRLREACGSRILKVIIETCLLTDEEKIAMCQVVTQAGADFIKTSTGFSTGGATPHDVKLLADQVGPGVQVKAAGGIRTLEDACTLLDLGASRLGTSRIVQLVKKQHPNGL